jgi:uncharacterized repeat protein (TIGR02543 family)
MKPMRIALVVLSLAAFAATSPVYGGNAYSDPIYGYTVTSDVLYGYARTPSNSNFPLLCDIYQPTDIGLGPVPTNRPAIVIQDGGAWTSGSKTNGRVVNPARYIVQRGFTVIITDYRYWDVGYYLGGFTGGTEFGSRPYDGLSWPFYLYAFPGIEVIRCGIEDFSVAMAWVRDHAAELGIDANRICACGGSAGGIDVLCNQYNNNPVPARYRANAVMCVVSTMYTNWNRINAGGPPCFMLNNTADPVIWYSPDIPNFNNRLTQLGIYHEQWFQATRVNHDFDYNEIVDGVPIMERMNQFCCYHLAGGPLQVGYTLTLAANPPGGGTISTVPSPRGDGTYEAGTIVTLIAYPGTGYAFSNWSGDASGSDNPVQITMNGNKNVTANFAELRYALTLASNPSGGGTIDAAPPPGGDGKYAYGTIVTLTASAGTGYAFNNWSGDASGSSNPVQVTMTANRSVTANFTELRYALTLASNPPEGGTIDAVPPPGGDGKYAYGTVVTLTANPGADYGFTNWSGDASGSSNPVLVTMIGDKSVTANFTLVRYSLTLTATPSGGGSIDATPPPGGDGKYANGTVVTLTANPAAGYLFSSWSGDACGSSSPTEVTMNGNKNVTAGFVRGFRLGLLVSHDNWGAVSVEPNLPMYPEGSTVTLTAVPVSGKSFAGWVIDDPNYPTDDPRYYNPVDPNTLGDPLVLPLTMNGNMQVEADFKCGSGLNQVLPVLSLVFGACVLFIRVSRRSGSSRRPR